MEISVAGGLENCTTPEHFPFERSTLSDRLSKRTETRRANSKGKRQLNGKTERTGGQQNRQALPRPCDVAQINACDCNITPTSVVALRTGQLVP